MPITIRVPRRSMPPAVDHAVESGATSVAVDPIADDLLEGAAEIAVYLFGASAHARRAHTAIKEGLPHFKIGNRIFARRSAINNWVAVQEQGLHKN
jgi:hypothetical protein